MQMLTTAQGILGALLWGLIATVAMTTILQASQGFWLSRLRLSFLAGTLFTSDRSKAEILGYFAFILGGWIFAELYLLFFISIGYAS